MDLLAFFHSPMRLLRLPYLPHLSSTLQSATIPILATYSSAGPQNGQAFGAHD